ncbi:coagulation factor V-like [Saccostrea echinata]|uniref:coagulation factor V-like n=1 Tax=Saccostrea echinata TaxID=191078 RepID=UPI002A82ACEE|nr:coagulation factor V-like [Saccostrea echinata]
MDSWRNFYLCLFSMITISYGKDIVYYVAIEEIDWTYKQTDQSESVFRKAVFREYKDHTFTARKPVTSQQGLLGPVIRATVGDTLRIQVKNNAKRPYSFYTDNLNTKKNESGAAYLGSPVYPGSTLTYVYTVTDANVPPALSMEQCMTSLYYSDVNLIRDTNTGLVGMIVVCKSDVLPDIREIFLHYGTIYETESWYNNTNGTDSLQHTAFSTINGYTHGNLPDIEVCINRKVRLYMTSLGGQNDIHTVVLYGHQFEIRNQRIDALSLYPGASIIAEFLTLEEGVWLLTTQHKSDNLYARLRVSACTNSRPAQKLSGNIRKYYIAAERAQLSNGSAAGPVVFQEYTNSRFNIRKESNHTTNGKLGPTIYAETRDLLKVVFYNRADGDLSLNPHGLRVGKVYEGVFYDDNSRSVGKKAVPANSLKTYYWSVPEDVSPALYDDPCLVRHYTSGLGHNKETFLFGPVKICEEGYLPPETEREIFMVYKDEKINGLPTGVFPSMSVCLKEDLTFHLMSFGTSDPQSFVVGGGIIKQRGHVLNVMEARENSIATYTITMVKTGNWSVRSFNSGNTSVTLSVNDCGASVGFVYSSKDSTHNIGIKEDFWEYSQLSDWTSKSPGYQMGPRFKKVMFAEYFSLLFYFEKSPPDSRDKTLYGPQLSANVGDRIKIEMKNMGKRNYSLYVDGLSDSAEEDIRDEESSKITWNITESIGPGSADPPCILKPYYSKTNTRDIPSGLFGPLVICSPSVSPETVESTRQQKVFMVGSVDETQSWYFEENLKDYAGIVNTSHPRFTEVNAIRVVNGYSDGTIKNMTIPTGDDVYFHFLNIGKHLVTIHLYGVNIGDSNQEGIGRSTITLYPWASKSFMTRFETPGSFLYEELLTERYTTRILGYYTVVAEAKTTE